MYLNDISILYYLLIIALGVVAGQFSDWMIKRSMEEKTTFSKEITTEYKNNFKPNYILIGIMIILDIVIL